MSLSEEIDAGIQEATSGVRPFADSDLELVRTLQEAPRNQGRVDMMRVVSTGRFVAVKRMPNSWVRSGPEDFARHAGGSLELPWFDIGLTRYLHEQAFQHGASPSGSSGTRSSRTSPARSAQAETSSGSWRAIQHRGRPARA